MRNKLKGLGPLFAIVATLALAVLAGLFSTCTADTAHASLSSGLPAGPVGSPVISTVAYTNASDLEVVGDSITVRSYKKLPAELPGWRIAINAQSGANTAQGIDRLVKQLNAGARLPKRLVMATGANDVFAPAAMKAQIARLLTLVHTYSPDTEVYWVNMSVHRPGKYAFADAANTNKVNQLIRLGCTRTAVQPCTLIDWAGLLASGNRASLIDAGGVHPTEAGQVRWAKMIAAAVR